MEWLNLHNAQERCMRLNKSKVICWSLYVSVSWVAKTALLWDGHANCWHYQGLNCERFQRLRLKLEICQLHTLLCIVKFYFCTSLVIVNVCSVTCLDNYCDCAECSLQIHNLFLLLKLALFKLGQEDAFGLDLFCWQSILLSWDRGVEDKNNAQSLCNDISKWVQNFLSL